MTGAELAEDVARRWRAMTALDALLDAVERGVPEAVRDAAAQPDLRDAMRLDLPSRLEALACLAVCGCPELAAEAFQRIREDPSLVRAEIGGGQTLLHRAAIAWDVPFSALLLDLGADPNAREHGGHTPLNRAGN
ncbi:MAG TPA: ankyrin repeat domain-containing protein, partial [Chthonomonadaceae bacterium]|nr:ankyrin repeat domain-containing protein [Chthonomonadaceae bacterium]